MQNLEKIKVEIVGNMLEGNLGFKHFLENKKLENLKDITFSFRGIDNFDLKFLEGVFN